jgi:hypothetical protein
MGLRRVDCKTGWITDSEGVSYCYLDGLLHREDGPAITHPDGRKIWYLHGKLHREDGPAISYPNGSQGWYRKGELHREDGPAVSYPNGTQWWYLKGKEVDMETVLDTPEKREAYLLEESIRRL